MKNPSTTRLASALIVGQNPINDERKTTMEDIDGGLHPAVDGQTPDEDEDEVTPMTRLRKKRKQVSNQGSELTMFVDWLLACLLNVPATGECISRTDLLRQFYTEVEVADQTFHLTQSQYTDTGPTSPSTDPITPGAWQGSHWSANFEVTSMTRPPKKIPSQAGFEPGIFRSRGGRLNH